MKIVRFLILTAALLSVMLLPAAAWEQCPVHAFDYHSFPGELIDYVGQEAFDAWCNPYQAPDENGCYENNIYNFIHDFDIPYEVFAAWYYGYSYYHSDHVPALLYSDDLAAVEQYYSRSAEIKRETTDSTVFWFSSFKQCLEEDARNADDAASRAFVDAFCEDGRVCTANWSIADYIRITGITQDDLTARLHWCLMQYDVIKKEPGYDAAYLIDFTPLYETDMTGDAYEATPEFLRVHTEDALVCSRGYENLKLPDNYAAPPTADSGLLPSLVIFAMSSAAILLYRKKKDKKS